MDNALIISEILQQIMVNDLHAARESIAQKYPFTPNYVHHRRYTEREKMQIFLRDGFIDQYSGKKLVNPGVLKCITFCFPDEFPYHPHWKMRNCHTAYWELLPTIDHIYPIARGGEDSVKNRVCTSMLNNSIKSNWTLEELHWELYPAGELRGWDGLTTLFLKLANQNEELLEDTYIYRWYRASKALLEM